MIKAGLFLCTIVAFISFMAAYALDSKAQAVWWKRRASIAAVIGGMMPMLLPAIAFAASGDPRTERGSMYLVLVVFGIILSALVGYPVAYLYSRRCEHSREAEAFE